MTTDHYASLSSQGLKGIEVFTLDYNVTWPLSIVLSRRIITKYQLLSRLLYFSKHVERRLLSSWISLQSCKEIPTTNLRKLLMESYLLRHRMLQFIQNFVYYITFEVIHPRNHEFITELTQILNQVSSNSGSFSFNHHKDINEIMELHEKFLDNCLKECLLASSDLLKILTKIMTTCLMFADHMVKLFHEITKKFEKKEEFFLQERKKQTAAGGGGGLIAKSQTLSKDNLDSTTPATAAGEGGGGLGAGKSNKQQPISKKQAEKLANAVLHKQWKLINYSELLFQEIKHESFHRILMKFSATFDTQVRMIIHFFL
jgi:hypothetical protein